MNRHYRKSRRSRLSRQAGKLFPSIALVVVGCAGFYLAMQWFRGDAEDAPALAQEVGQVTEETISMASVPSVVPTVAGATYEQPLLKTEELSAPLVSAFDGQHTGRVQSYLTKNSADMIVLAYLPALDMAADSYHVWLLKDGLADVKDMGQLAPRADGSWVLNFTAGPSTGIVDPRVYKSIVIMREPNDGNTAPSGYRIAEAKF
jgi:hypothetical protein